MKIIVKKCRLHGIIIALHNYKVYIKLEGCLQEALPRQGAYMEYIIGFIVLIIGLFIIGTLSRKKSYKEIDRLEQWKIDIMNRPVLEEMTKVKQLNMTGQTEVLFERWRNEWDEIVTIDLPDVEEYLFDAEEYIDKYRFKRAKEVQNKIDQKLTKTEAKINKIITELHELIGSEEKNRQEIDELKEAYREARKNLLAHRYSFGKSELRLELFLDDIIHQFESYQEKTENGNYLEAREEVLLIKDNLEKIAYKMEVIPQLIIDCQSIIPSQLSELRDGYREMLEEGYSLEHIPLEKEINQLEAELENYISLIERGDVNEVPVGIKNVKDSIEVLYDLLEKEVHAKALIIKSEGPTSNMLEDAHEENEHLKKETKIVQQTYQIKEQELEQSRQMETRLTDLTNRFYAIKYKIEQNTTANTVLGEELQDVKDQIEIIQAEQAAFKEKLQMLRKDEMIAREKITEIKKRMNESIRLVAKSNIPGLPDDFKYLFDDSKEAIQNVLIHLEQKPLDMQAVLQYLELAVLTVDKLAENSNDLIENVMLAERVIQYGNRYKSRYSSVANRLKDAELEFRSFNYQEALEQAASAIEEVEPGALKRIENMIKNHE
jgi:septation ring formation regulator